ncbi:MAG: histidine kinase [Labilithrix sp.]|nr:histidine kinase [Labilithrix sp.]
MTSTATSGPEHERGERERLADLILRCLEKVEKEWLERIKPIVGDRRLSPSELRDSMPEYLARLADGLRGTDSIEVGGSASWVGVAREHAETRVHLGFDIDQLVREFIVLRQVLFDLIEEQDVGIDVHQWARVADLIEGAIAAAVKSYVESRDWELRKQEAEHVGFITHELRNPLSTAVLGIDQLRRASAHSAQQDHTLDLIERSLRRLTELIDGILLIEKCLHSIKPHPSVMTLGQLLENSVGAAKAAAEAKGLRFDAHFDPHLAVEADPELSASAIDNVLQNAVKYTDSGDVRVVAEDHAQDIELHVRDSCPGIPPEDLRTIFEPFRRGHSLKPGTGLGLAIARRAVEAQGGKIQAESGEGGGCHFWLTFPKPRH